MSLTTTHSTLMHASIAYLSPEMQTFDSIIRLHSKRRLLIWSHSHTTVLAIPAELLLLIRAELQALLSSHLRALSKDALTRYESSLRALLCAECRFYNEEIFGSDVWEWESFNGPCACDQIGRQPGNPRMTQIAFPVKPKEFIDRHHWLESYLSHQYRHLSTSSPSSSGIWDTVSDVLREFGCVVQRDNSNPRSAPTSHGRFILLTNGNQPSRWVYRPKFVSIVPSLSGEEPGVRERSVVFRTVQRELRLDCEHEEETDIGSDVKNIANYTKKLPVQFSGRRPFMHSPFRDSTWAFFFVVLPSVGTVLSFPVTVTTLLVTIVCYYCRPSALRIF